MLKEQQAPTQTQCADAPILVEQHGRVVVIRLNRPKKLNALNQDVMNAVVATLAAYDRDPHIGCFVITGNERAFAAGADIKELAAHNYVDAFHADLLTGWDAVSRIRTPKIAAVSGYALGGGCELALMCDTIYAAENAKFGQPEIKLGLIPGMGGSQRLTKRVGRALAMDMILTGRMIDADEARQAGLIARILPTDGFDEAVLEIAQAIAGYGKMAAIAGREAVLRAEETSLHEGLLFERRTYHALWATADAHEGMQAFLEKRTPEFRGV